jgi:hypothetical protein
VKDPVAVGLGALACGTGLGGGTIVATLVIVRTLERHLQAASYEETAANPVLAGTFAGLAVAAAFGWRRSRALDNVSQRGVIAVLATVGAVLVGFIAWPVDRLLGSLGLLAWGLASFTIGVAASRWAVSGSGTGPDGTAP